MKVVQQQQKNGGKIVIVIYLSGRLVLSLSLDQAFGIEICGSHRRLKQSTSGELCEQKVCSYCK